MYLKEFIFIGLFYFKNKLGKSTAILMNGKVSKQIINKFRKTNKLEEKKKTLPKIVIMLFLIKKPKAQHQWQL